MPCRVHQIFAVRAGRAIAPRDGFGRASLAGAAIGGVCAVRHVADAAHLSARGHAKFQRPAVIDILAIGVLPRFQIVQHLGRLAAGDAEGHPPACAAAIKAQHEPWAFRRAAVMLGPKAESAMKAAQQRGLMPHMHKTRPPNERAIGEYIKMPIGIERQILHRSVTFAKAMCRFKPLHMARKWWAYLFLILLVAGGGVGFIWQEATSRLETELGRWTEARRAEGWRITHAPPERAGFPIAASLKLSDLRILAPNGLGWHSERTTLALFAQDHRQLRLSFEGAQRLSHPRGEMPVLGDSLTARLRLDGQGGTLEGDALRFGQELALRRLSVDLFGWAMDLRGEQIVANGLPRIDTLHFTGRSLQPLGVTAAAWRAAGGTLSVERFELRSGQASALLSATITLDAALQPEGRGNLAVTNVAEVISLMTASGLIAPQAAPALRTVLGLAARVPPQGGPPRVELPLELRNRRLTAARLPLGVLPPLDWR